MIDLKNLDRWQEIAPGSQYAFAGKNSRVVTVTIRCEYKSPIYLVDKKGKLTFLANIDGFGKIKFRMPAGEHAITCGQDLPVYITTMEMERASIELADAVIFTKVVERRARDPRFEEMMFRMQVNLEKRLEQVRNDDNKALESRRKSMVEDAKQIAKDELERSKTGEVEENVDSKSSTTKPAEKSKGDDGDGKGGLKLEPVEKSKGTDKAA